MSKSSLLWRLEAPDLPFVSYLFGTMHVRDQRAFGYLDLLDTHLQNCSVYAAEMNLDEMNQSVLASSMDLPDGQRLSDLLPEKWQKRLNKLLQRQLGMGLPFFDRNQPILVSNLLTESLLSAEMPASLDMTLWQMAKAKDKITLGIESFEEQMRILKQISLDQQLKSLKWLVKNFKSFRKQLFKLTHYYEKSDIKALYKATRKQAKGMRKLMIFDRNYLMADRIGQLAREQNAFVSIGAGHLAGGKGVLRLLKQQGFKVKPIKLATT